MITSRQNQWIKRVRRALEKHDDEILLEGPKMIRDALALGWEPLVILQEEDRAPLDVEALAVERAIFRSLVSTETSQGLVALFPRPAADERAAFSGSRRLVALDAVQDPGNVGTIVRTAAAFDASAVICLPGTADPWSAKAIRSSAGAVLSIPLLRMATARLIELAAANDIPLLTATLDGSTDSLEDLETFVLVLGSEGQGVSRDLSSVSRGVRIPMSSRVESLNVAAAAAILLAQSYRGDVQSSRVQSSKSEKV